MFLSSLALFSILISGVIGFCVAFLISNVYFARFCWFELLSFFLFIVCTFVHRFEKMLNEMLSYLERQPRDKERRIAWLKFIEPIFNALGLFLLAHFRRIFPLFFQWMHVDDDETVLLVRLLHLLTQQVSVLLEFFFGGKVMGMNMSLTFQCSAGSQKGSDNC